MNTMRAEKFVRRRLVASASLLVLAVVVVALAVYFISSGVSGSAYVSDKSNQAPKSDGSSGPITVRVEGEASPAGAKVAPKLSGISGWFNTQSPLSLDDLRGKVVLVDFWTYSCVNCIRTLPHLTSWHEKYSDLGLVIIGVHSPEFEFEKIPENVQKAISQYELPYAVAMDNDFRTWDDYNVLYWPTKFLIDGNGYIRYSLIGERGYDETERTIRELLIENGASLDSMSMSDVTDVSMYDKARTRDSETSLTVELFAGNEWSDPNGVHYIRNPDFYYQKDEVRMYKDPGHRRNNYIFLHGSWRNGPKYLTHGRKTERLDDYVSVQFNASSVNAVMSPKDAGAAFELVITLDGEYLTPSQVGEDVTIMKDGVSMVNVDSPRMYQLVELGEFESHKLRLSSNSDQFSLYSLTFGAYREGP